MCFWPRRLQWQSSLLIECDRAARRVRAPACPPAWQRARWTARVAIAALDGDRADPARPLFRSVDPETRDLRSKTAADWLALPVPALLVILCWHCWRMRWSVSLGSSRLRAHARPAPGRRASLSGRCGDPRRRQRARCAQALSRPIGRPECPMLRHHRPLFRRDRPRCRRRRTAGDTRAWSRPV